MVTKQARSSRTIEVEPMSESETTGVYRVEAEVDSENYAMILRETIEQTDGCSLTAFDHIEGDDVE